MSHHYGKHNPHPPYVAPRGEAPATRYVLVRFGKDDRSFDTQKAAFAALAKIREAELANLRPWSPAVLALPVRPMKILDTLDDFLSWCVGITDVERLAFARVWCVVAPTRKADACPVVVSSYRDELDYLFAKGCGPYGAECSVLVGAEFASPIPATLRAKLPKGDPNAVPLW